MKRAIKILSFFMSCFVLTSCNTGRQSQTTPHEPYNPPTTMVPYQPPETVQQQSFSVTWKNWDGSLIAVDRNVLEGTMPQYRHATPLHESDEYYTYFFSGWKPALAPVERDVEYTAQFSKNERVFEFQCPQYLTCYANNVFGYRHTEFELSDIHLSINLAKYKNTSINWRCSLSCLVKKTKIIRSDMDGCSFKINFYENDIQVDTSKESLTTDLEVGESARCSRSVELHRQNVQRLEDVTVEFVATDGKL